MGNAHDRQLEIPKLTYSNKQLEEDHCRDTRRGGMKRRAGGGHLT